VAADFFSVEVWTPRELQRFIVRFFIDLCSRQVEIAGVASNANGLWMSQIGRNITDAVDGILLDKRCLIHDRNPLFTAEFVTLLADVCVASVKLPSKSPNLNAYAERFVRTSKEYLRIGTPRVTRLERLARSPASSPHSGLPVALVGFGFGFGSGSAIAKSLSCSQLDHTPG
jgi:hypothetical protein